MGLGVRTGKVSPVDGGGYLANVDVDVKSGEARHLKEALAFVEKKWPGIYAKAPIVKTGYGLRLFVQTAEPVDSKKMAVSRETCVVRMPSAEVSSQQLQALKDGRITQKQLDDGYRVRPCWEVELMSTGRQVVLPPSLHPDTGKPYIWQRALTKLPNIIVTDTNKGADSGQHITKNDSDNLKKFVPVEVDLVSSTLPDNIVDMILSGSGTEHDRSNGLYIAAIAMVKEKFTDDQILSVLTDQRNFLGDVAYRHRKTNNRAYAAAWVRDHTLRKVRKETDPSRVFADEPDDESPLLDSPEAVEAQAAEFADLRGPWQDRLERNKQGQAKATLENTVLVLTHAVAKNVFKKDLFAERDNYGTPAPWTTKKWEGVDGPVTDDCAVNIKVWLARYYGFEPTVTIIHEAFTEIATRNCYNKVIDQLEDLPPWDGKIRLDTWLHDHFGAKGPVSYVGEVFRKWMVASVTRAYQPGYKFDWMPIFEGVQGEGKSYFGALLFGEEYFIDHLEKLDNKDAALALQGMRCAEFNELANLRRDQLEVVKGFITRQIDKVRPHYGRKLVSIRRNCIFYGTTDKDQYLTDDAGNRRFNPIMVGKLDVAALKRDRTQLWAEAVFIYKNSLETTLYLEGEALEQAREAQGEKMVEDSSLFMVARLKKWLAEQSTKPEIERQDCTKVHVVELFGDSGPFSGIQENDRNIRLARKSLKLIGANPSRNKFERFWTLPTGN